MGRGPQASLAGKAPPLKPRRWLRRAELLGGAGSGLAIELDRFDPRVSVFRNGGPPFAVPGQVDPAEHKDAVFIGVYDLVDPLGPDTPIYVAT
jgi:hypothetical protein